MDVFEYNLWVKKIAISYLLATLALLISVITLINIDLEIADKTTANKSSVQLNDDFRDAQELTFPADHYPHNNSIEWWYYNGHLSDSLGNPYGFHAVVFKGRSGSNQVGHMAHTSLTDINHQTHYQSTKLGNTSGAETHWYRFIKDDWKIQAKDNYHEIEVSSADHTLKLDMVGSGNLILHNANGYIGDETGWTYYYSEPNLETSGELILNGKKLEVLGSSWMDHQWGEFTVTGYPSGWQWFAISLPNNQYLMLSESRDNNKNLITYATLKDSSGSIFHIDGEEIELINLDYWESPKTGALYPRKWILSIKKHNILIELESAVLDQELTEAFPPQTIYWEGVATVSGIINNNYFTEKDDYRAVVELVGYVDVNSIPINKA